MSRQAWGQTGRVEIVLPEGARYWRCVNVDGVHVGLVATPAGHESRYDAIHESEEARQAFPSLDHAVMWVLRRAAPDVWREERGPVWLVRLSYDDMSREWLAINPRRSWCVAAETCADALGEADRLARQETK